jgi:hypothetical protein
MFVAVRIAVLTVLVACASAAHPAPPRPSEADITARSHAIVAALDRADYATLDAATAPSFINFEGGKPRDRGAFLARVKERDQDLMFASRSWASEHVAVHGDEATFIGKATEEAGGNTRHGGYIYVGWYVLHWVRSGAAWQLSLWTWQAEPQEADFWNGVFHTGRGFDHEPNKLLVETIRGVAPGKALDLAMGQGRNALYLASQGWQTTGVDISDVGLRLAREQSTRKKLALETIAADVDSWDLGVERWDLVTMIYAGNPAWFAKVRAGLRAGGLVVVEYFAKATDSPDGYEPGQVAKAFDGSCASSHGSADAEVGARRRSRN